MGKPCSMQFIKSCIFYYKSHEDLYQVLQVTCTCLKIEDLYDKNITTIVPSYTAKKKISLICCCWHCYSCCTLVTIQTATMIFSGISLYYGDIVTFLNTDSVMDYQYLHRHWKSNASCCSNMIHAISVPHLK